MAFDLLLPFDSDDPEFVRGFEAGRMWANLGSKHTFTVHASNAEMVMRIGEAAGIRGRGVELGSGFIEVTFDEA